MRSGRELKTFFTFNLFMQFTLVMDPEEISRLAREAKKKKKVQAETPKKPEYNPLDWMDFKHTRKWMGENLKLSDRFYSFVVWMLLASGLVTWIFIQDEQIWAFYGMIGLWI